MHKFSENNLIYDVEVFHGSAKDGDKVFSRWGVDFNKVLTIIEETAEKYNGFVLLVTPYSDSIVAKVVTDNNTDGYEVVITPKVGYENNQAIADVIDLELS